MCEITRSCICAFTFIGSEPLTYAIPLDHYYDYYYYD